MARPGSLWHTDTGSFNRLVQRTSMVGADAWRDAIWGLRRKADGGRRHEERRRLAPWQRRDRHRIGGGEYGQLMMILGGAWPDHSRILYDMVALLDVRTVAQVSRIG